MPTARATAYVRDLANHPLVAHQRPLSADEVRYFAEAIDAGALIVPRLLREYRDGSTRWPFQFEGCSRSVWKGDEHAQPFVEAAIVARDAFLERCSSGDLAPVIARIVAASRAEAA
jgi:hypothetical protein